MAPTWRDAAAHDKLDFMRLILVLLAAAVHAAAQSPNGPALRAVREIPATGKISDDGTLLAAVNETSISILRASDGRQIHRIILPKIAKYDELDYIGFNPLAFSPDGKTLLVELQHHRDWKQGEVAVYAADLEKETLRQLYLTRRDCGHLMSDTPGGMEPTICPWALAAYSPDGKRIAISVGDYLQQTVRTKLLKRYEREVVLIDTAGKALGDFKDVFRQDPEQYGTTPDPVAETATGASAAGFGPDGHLLGIIRDSTGCEVRDLTAGVRVSFLDDCSIKETLGFIAPGAVSNPLTQCSKDCTAKYWDAATGKVRKIAYGAQGGGALFTADGAYALAITTLQGAKVELRAAPFQDVLFSSPTTGSYDWSLALDGSVAFQRSGDKTIVYETGLRASAPASAPAAPPMDVDAVPDAKTPSNPDAYALVIGVEKYRQDGIPAVDFAAHDAQTVNSYLVGAMGFDPKNVVLLTNGQATRTDFEKNLKWLSNRVTAKSRVFVYFAGHGSPNTENGQGYLLPYEADPAYLDETAFPIANLYAALGKLPAKDVTVVLDACFSGQGGRSLIAKGTRPLVSVVQSKAEPNTLVLAAAGSNQVSASFPEARHGLLTYYLLAGLHGEADAKHDGLITGDELYAYVRPAVERAAKLQNVEQTPNLMSPPDAGARPWIALAPKK